ncbi:MAG: hypothetical protein WC444_00975 [Candidatus Paceibacterota bacterium]
MDQEIKTILDTQGAKIEAIYVSVEKTRKYFLTTMWVTVLAILLPLLGLFFVLPSFLSTYIEGLTQY